MPNQGNAEPAGPQQLQPQLSINFSSAIPIKKRRFPIICPQSPPPPPSPERKIPCSEDQESKTEQEPKIPDEKCPSPIEAKSPSSDSIVSKEATPSNIESVHAKVDVLSSKPHEAKPTVSLKPVPDSGNKTDISSKEEFPGPEVPESCTKPTVSLKPVPNSGNKTDISSKEKSPGPEVPESCTKPTVSLKPVPDTGFKTDISSKEKSPGPEVPEICTGSQTATVKQEVCGLELSMALGPKEPLVVPVPVLEHQKSGSLKSDPSLLSLALSEKSVCTTVGDVNRSNWDLNTTMDVWGEGLTNCAGIGGFVGTDNFRDEKSCLTTSENTGLSLNKGKRILDDYGPDSSNARIQPASHCKVDDSLGLRLAMPLNKVSASASRLGLQPLLHLSPMNVNRPVKSEPVDENCKLDCSVGSSSSSSNMGLLKLGTVKTELLNNRGLEIVLHSPVIPDKLVNCKPEDASSSSSCLPVPTMMMPQGSFRPRSQLELKMSGDLSSYLELSLRGKETHGNQKSPCDAGNSSVAHTEKCKLARVDEHTVEAPDDDEKMIIPAAKNEESIQSDCGSKGKGKEDEELEEGEVREPLQHSAVENLIPIVVAMNTENLGFVRLDSQRSDLLDDQDMILSENDEKDYSLKENHEKNDSNKESSSFSCEPKKEDNVLQNVSETMLEIGFDEKRFVSVSPDRKDIEEASGKEISGDMPTNMDGVMIGFELEDASTTQNKVVNEIGSVEDKVEASLDGNDAAKDASNKSRIINLARASLVTSPCKTRSIPNRLLTPRSGKERYSDLDGEIQQRGNRDENYAGGSNKFAKDRVHDQRNSRSNFMHGRGRMQGRFGSLRGEWDNNDHDFASENSYGTSDYRPVRRKHASSISDVEIDCNGYDFQQDGNNRRKQANDEFSPTLRRTNLRRLSPGDNNRDGPANRGNQTFRRFPRNNNNNMSPNRCNGESGSDVMGLRHSDKFMRHLSDDMINPVYNHQQVMYDELDGPIERGNRNFSNIQRKGYPRIRSKSPDRSRTRSPGPWSHPRRRSPNGLQDLPQHRSPGFYRTGRMRSPGLFRDEMVPRRRGGSPSYVARHLNNDLRDVDTGREHVLPRSSGNSNRRTSPARAFPRNGRRTDVLDSREMGDGDEYMNNGPMQSNKFHELRGDRNIDERRKFIDRRGPGPGRSFRPNYNGDGENFRFRMNDGPRPYRFCPDGDTEFVERGNMREREFDGRIKHQNMVQNRRNRNIEEEEQDGNGNENENGNANGNGNGNGNYRPVERVWHDDGFDDGRVKRRRF